MSLTPVLIGMDGICAGEHFVLVDGVAMSVGRSSTCEVCLQKVPRYTAMTEEQRAKLVDFNVISRKHLTITVTGSTVRLDNHSGSGTWCDEARFDKSKTVDIGKGAVGLRLGPSESFQLMLLDQAGLDRLNARTTPIQLTTTRFGNEKGDDLTTGGPRTTLNP